jgi:hypothetical protein
VKAAIADGATITPELILAISNGHGRAWHVTNACGNGYGASKNALPLSKSLISAIPVRPERGNVGAGRNPAAPRTAAQRELPHRPEQLHLPAVLVQPRLGGIAAHLLLPNDFCAERRN